MNVLMVDGWIGREIMVEWMICGTARLIGGQTDGLICGWMNGLIDLIIESITDGMIGEWMDG